MSDSDSEQNKKYVRDTRIPCKYGIKCYQKNPEHRKKYKHPHKYQNDEHSVHATKKLKIERPNNSTKEVVTKNEVSDSDDYDIESGSDVSSDKEMKNNGASKPKISNAVSDSDEADNENDKNKSDKGKDGESKENASMYDKSEGEPTTKLSPEQFIKQKFLVDMPKDFYDFWDLCKKIKPFHPLEALKDVGLTLVGPFDVLAGRFDKRRKLDAVYLLHWRYYFDPPEFQTVLKGDDFIGYHIGYFRDSPEDPPAILVSNCGKRDGILRQMGSNIFSAVNMYLNDLKDSGNPFKKMHIGRVQSEILKEAAKLKLDLSKRTPEIIAREKKIVTRTLNKIGLVVPYNNKNQLGYRPLSFGNEEITRVLTKIQNAAPEQRSKYLSELQPLLTNTSIATDECDFGTGIELGWNILSHGIDSLNSTVERFLAHSYRMLNKEPFAKIAEAHMRNRKKGCDLSVI